MVIVGIDDDDEKRRKSSSAPAPADASRTGPDGFRRRKSASSVP